MHVSGDHRDSSAPKDEALVDAIAKEEEHLARLESEQAHARARLDALRADLGGVTPERRPPPHLPVLPNGPVPQSPADKVTLFRQLFRGRQDVYPTRFVSRATRRSARTSSSAGCASCRR
jgi:hypothetical protein